MTRAHIPGLHSGNGVCVCGGGGGGQSETLWNLGVAMGYHVPYTLAHPLIICESPVGAPHLDGPLKGYGDDIAKQ